MSISEIHAPDESYYKQPDLFNIQRLMCPHCGFIFDFQFPLDDERLGWTRLSDEPYHSVTYHDYEVTEENPDITEHCSRCGLEIKKDTLILINVSPLVKFDDIRKIVAKGESETLEIKSRLMDKFNPKAEIKKKMKEKIARTIASFANNRGGMLIIGVEDNENKEIIGIENILNSDDKENLLRNINEIIISQIKPKPYYHINFLEDEDKIIAIITVYTARNICYVNDKVPIRNGESSYYLSDQAAIDNLIASRQQNNQAAE